MGYTQIGNIKLQYDETTVDIGRIRFTNPFLWRYCFKRLWVY